MIEVVGGTYEELCRFPQWHQFFGSGGRAAAAIATLGSNVRLHSFSEAGKEARRRALADAFGFDVVVTSGAPEVSFEYFHSLTPIQYVPSFEPLEDPSRLLQVNGDLVVRFGMLEGDALVRAKRCVYDPQSPASPQSFESNGSCAQELAIVCNLGEAELLTGQRGPESCARHLAHLGKVAVVKAGAAGAWVAADGKVELIPSYRTTSVFPIGSGDVFTAAFAVEWMERGANPLDAAYFASRATAMYCATMSFPTVEVMAKEAQVLQPVQLKRPLSPRPLAYLAGPFFTMAQRWLVEEVRRELNHVGLDVFSPFHEVGMGRSDEEIAHMDLEGLTRADVVLALLEDLDPGTLFEVGFATRANKPVVCLVQSGDTSDFTMLAGTGALVTSDLATAAYSTAWAAYERAAIT